MNPKNCAFPVVEPCEASGEAGPPTRKMKALMTENSVGPRSAGAMAAVERSPTAPSSFRVFNLSTLP